SASWPMGNSKRLRASRLPMRRGSRSWSKRGTFTATTLRRSGWRLRRWPRSTRVWLGQAEPALMKASAVTRPSSCDMRSGSTVFTRAMPGGAWGAGAGSIRSEDRVVPGPAGAFRALARIIAQATALGHGAADVGGHARADRDLARADHAAVAVRPGQ